MFDTVAGLRWFDWFGYLGMALSIAAFFMRTMIPLRLLAIAATVGLLIYGAMSSSWPNVMLNLVALPVHAWRWREMKMLVRRVAAAQAGQDLSIDWLKPFMTRQRLAAGEILFRRGDAAEGMYFVVAGRLRLAELDCGIGTGEVVGEIAMFSAAHRRTATAVAVEDVELLSIAEADLKQLYFQNPQFGFLPHSTRDASADGECGAP